MKLPLVLGALSGVMLLAVVATAGEPVVSLRVEPAEVAIGQPFRVVLECEHDAGAAPRFAEPDLGELWWREAPPRTLVTPLADQPGRSSTSVTWQLVGLEPGEHELELPAGRVEGLEALELVELPRARVVILGELAEDEDAPRDLAGFRPPPEERLSALTAGAFVLGGLTLALLGLAAWLVASHLRRKRSQPARPERSAADELAGIDPTDPGEARRAFELASRAVREALDAELGEDLSGCTDEEWIERRESAEGLAAPRLARACELLQSSQRVKYAMEQPTRWAVEECLGAARAVVSGEVEEEVTA